MQYIHMYFYTAKFHIPTKPQNTLMFSSPYILLYSAWNTVSDWLSYQIEICVTKSYNRDNGYI